MSLTIIRIDQLEKAGIDERVLNPQDRRSLLISLTAEGFDIIGEAVAAHVKTQATLVSGLSKKERRDLDVLLKALLAGFEED